MKGFANLIGSMEEFKKISFAIEHKQTPVLITGLSNVHKSGFIYSFTSLLCKSGLVVVPDEATAVRMCEDINMLAGRELALLFPSRELTFQQVQGVSREYEHARLKVLGETWRRANAKW